MLLGAAVRIGGFQRVSLIDYPGKITSIVFLQGCNMRCPFCHNSELVFMNTSNAGLYDEEMVLRKIEESKGFVEAVEITGGEPTLQKGLAHFIRRCKELGFLVKLDTNGSDPDAVRMLLDEKLIDYVAMDIKAPLNTERYRTATGTQNDTMAGKIGQTAMLLLGSDIDYEFRTTVVPGIVEVDDLIKIAGSVKGARAYYLQQFTPTHSLDPAFRTVKPYDSAKLRAAKDAIENLCLVRKCEIREVGT